MDSIGNDRKSRGAPTAILAVCVIALIGTAGAAGVLGVLSAADDCEVGPNLDGSSPTCLTLSPPMSPPISTTSTSTSTTTAPSTTTTVTSSTTSSVVGSSTSTTLPSATTTTSPVVTTTVVAPTTTTTVPPVRPLVCRNSVDCYGFGVHFVSGSRSAAVPVNLAPGRYRVILHSGDPFHRPAYQTHQTMEIWRLELLGVGGHVVAVTSATQDLSDVSANESTDVGFITIDEYVVSIVAVHAGPDINSITAVGATITLVPA